MCENVQRRLDVYVFADPVSGETPALPRDGVLAATGYGRVGMVGLRAIRCGFGRSAGESGVMGRRLPERSRVCGAILMRARLEVSPGIRATFIDTRVAEHASC